MQKFYAITCRKFVLVAAIILLAAQAGRSQSVQLPYQYQFYQKFNADVYNVENTAHTAMKPFLVDSTLQLRYDSLMAIGVNPDKKSWIYRKLFSEHLLDVRKPEYTFYFDLITENLFGRDFKDKDTKMDFKPVGFLIKSYVGLNTRGYQLGGTIGKKFSFYTSGFENQGVFAPYYSNYIDSVIIVPGQAYDRKFGRTSEKDWSYVTAIISYSPTKNINLALGQDKIFIGDGYRSLLLSDYASNYPLFRGTINIGPVQYTAIWAQMKDIKALRFDSYGSTRRKWAAIHYADWNINNRASIGFFNAYIAPETNDNGTPRGFDINYINPVLFASTKGSTNQPGNSIVGFTGKYKFLDKNAVYGQLLIDKIQGSTGGSANASGWQAGVRGADLLGVRNLNYLAEYNTVNPYAYTGAERLTSYSNNGEALAHPYGANFKEMMGILNYSVGKFDFQAQVIYAKYGLNDGGITSGKDIVQPFVKDDNTTFTNGQGLSTTLNYAEGTVSYVLNPRYNLRIEVAGLYRREKNALATQNTAMITFGLRSSFRNLYHDF